MRRNCIRDLVQIESELLGLDYELFQLFRQQIAPFGRSRGDTLGNERPKTGAHLDQSLGHELTNYLMSRIRVDLQFLAKRADGRKRLPRTKLSGDDGLFRGIDDLLVERDTGLEREAERDHVCTITASTPRGKKIFPG